VIQKPSISIGAIYKDVCNGYSKSTTTNHFIKHLNSIDLALIDEYEYEMLSYYKNKGAFLRDDLLKMRIKEGVWSEDKDKKITFLENNIRIMIDKKKKASIESQIDEIEEIVSNYEKDYIALATERNSILSLSAESLTSSAVTEFILSLSFYNDKELNNKSFEIDDVIDFSTQEMNCYIKEHRLFMNNLSNFNLRFVGANENVRGFIKASNNAESFFGVRGCSLTSNQIKLFDYAKYFSSLIERIQDITDDEKNHPDEIERRYILESNKQEVKPEESKSKLMEVFNKT
jgi:hypothetical protein